LTTKNEYNLCIFANFNFIISLVIGLIGPLYLVLIEDVAPGTTTYGIALGTLILFQAGASYFAGDILDRTGRKKLLYIISYSSSLLLILYTIVNSIWELFLLQAIAGMIMGITDTLQISVIGNMTTTANRDKEVGKFYAKIGVATALGFVFGGFAIGKFGLNPVFYVSAIAVFFSTILLMMIKESDNNNEYH
jgi:Major Facilitator Superfamily.